MEESDCAMLCSGDILDFSLGLVDSSIVSSLFGDLDTRSATGDEETDCPPLNV